MTELRHEDFSEGDRFELANAGNHLIVELHDIVFHNWDGMGFATWPPLEEDAAQYALGVRALIEQAETAVREARRYLASAERPARLRAHRRARTGDPVADVAEIAGDELPDVLAAANDVPPTERPAVFVRWEEGPPTGDPPDVNRGDYDNDPARGWWAYCDGCDWESGPYGDQQVAMISAERHTHGDLSGGGV
jgi:hypothetical protein